DWGDGTPDGTGVTASHTYAEDGTYTVTLTVTDDEGATDETEQTVSVSAPVGAVTYARDAFGRNLATGLGTADQGGAWALVQSAANYRVNGQQAEFIQPAGGSQRYAYLTGVSSTDTAVEVDIALPQRPVGGSSFSTVHLRRIGSEEYMARVIVAANGGVTAQLLRGGTVLTNVVTPVNMAAGDTIRLRGEATGTSPTELSMKVWKLGSAEPGTWTTTTTDSALALQAPGQVGLGVYLGGAVTNTPFQTRFDNFWAGSTDGAPQEPEPPANQDPVAAFTATTADLQVSVNGSASNDPDGSIASYSWNWGDGTPAGTGATATHTYATAGSYTVTLTVTDNGGATATHSESVTVTAPQEPEPPGPAIFAADDFNRAVGTLGAAQTGGNWTQTSGVANVGIEDGTARLTSQAASQTRTASLNSAVSDSTDLTTSFRVAALPTSSVRMYVSALGRVVGAEDYRARWLFSSNGAVQAQLSRGGTVIQWRDLPAFTLAPSTTYNVRLQVFGTAPTTLRSKIWVAGTTEPADWQLSGTDSTAALQTAGHVGISTYTGGGFTPLPYSVLFDDFRAQTVVP
ncbi:PKD domain-containing protein, partial [Leucobacter sp.]